MLAAAKSETNKMVQVVTASRNTGHCIDEPAMQLIAHLDKQQTKLRIKSHLELLWIVVDLQQYKCKH